MATKQLLKSRYMKGKTKEVNKRIMGVGFSSPNLELLCLTCEIPLSVTLVWSGVRVTLELALALFVCIQCMLFVKISRSEIQAWLSDFKCYTSNGKLVFCAYLSKEVGLIFCIKIKSNKNISVNTQI